MTGRITTTGAGVRRMPAPLRPRFAMTVFTLLVLGGLAMAQGAENDTFGKTTSSEAALIGVLYDLKQTQDKKPTSVDAASYCTVVDEFLSKNWDESVLNRYYRVANPLYTTQIFIPHIAANAAPKAFGAEKTVKPSLWIIHYKGQVSPPSPGSYRFWGCADDMLAVAVNGKTVLVGNRHDLRLPNVKWKASEPDGAQAANDNLRPGDWMDLKADEVIDLDAIIGERPGGYFNAFLLIEKKGEIYEKDQKGYPIFPIFQVAAFDTPALNNLAAEPSFSKGFPPWKSYQ